MQEGFRGQDLEPWAYSSPTSSPFSLSLYSPAPSLESDGLGALLPCYAPAQAMHTYPQLDPLSSSLSFFQQNNKVN